MTLIAVANGDIRIELERLGQLKIKKNTADPLVSYQSIRSLCLELDLQPEEFDYWVSRNAPTKHKIPVSLRFEGFDNCTR